MMYSSVVLVRHLRLTYCVGSINQAHKVFNATTPKIHFASVKQRSSLHSTSTALCSQKASDLDTCVLSALNLASMKTPSIIEFFESTEFKSLSDHDKESFRTMLQRKDQHQKLMEEYYKGELSTEEAANRVGFKLPVAGKYGDSQLKSSKKK